MSHKSHKIHIHLLCLLSLCGDVFLRDFYEGPGGNFGLDREVEAGGGVLLIDDNGTAGDQS